MLVVSPEAPIILYSNVPKKDELVSYYDSSVSYQTKNIVQFEDELFESMKDNNTDTPIASTTSLSWYYLGKSNRLKMFDEFLNTQTQHENELIYILQADDIDTLCLFGVVASSVKVEIYSQNDELLYEEEKSTFTRVVSNWWEWTVQKAQSKKILYFKNLPAFYGAKLKLSILFASSVAKCSMCVFGKSLDFGMTLTEPKPTSTIKNLISKEKNKDGLVEIKNNKTYKRVALSVLIDSKRVDEIQTFLEDYHDKPLLFIGVEQEDDFESLTVFGYCKEFEQPISLNKSLYQIEIEGII